MSKNIQVKITKTFANFLNKNLKNKYYFSEAYVVKFTPQEYSWYVQNTLNAEDSELDFDDNGNLIFKAIKIDYKEDMYAMPHFLTMKVLREAYSAAVKHKSSIIDEIDDILAI